MEIDQEIVHGHRFPEVLENGLRLAELGLFDLGYAGKADISAELYYVDGTSQEGVPAGVAHGDSRFSLYMHSDFVSSGASDAVEYVSLTGLHEVVHCLRFGFYPDLYDDNGDELLATEILAYGAEFAHRKMYFGRIAFNGSPDREASFRIMRMLLSGKPLGDFLGMSSNELIWI